MLGEKRRAVNLNVTSLLEYTIGLHPRHTVAIECEYSVAYRDLDKLGGRLSAALAMRYLTVLKVYALLLTDFLSRAQRRAYDIATWELFLLVAILVVCALLRLFNLAGEAMTTDEYATYLFAPEFSFAAYLPLNSYRIPDNLPCYFMLYWAWTQLVGSGVLSARLLSVICGILSCIVLFLITRRCFNARAGLVSSALYALSPFLIFHDQAIRPYALFTLLSGISIYAALQLLNGGPHERRWIVVSVLVNALMVYTHLLGVILLAAEGLFLLLIWRHRIMKLVSWAVGHTLLLAPIPLLVTIPDSDPRYLLPEISRVFYNHFAPDAVKPSVELMPSHENWAFQPLLANLYQTADPVSAVLLGVVSLAAVFLVPALCHLRRHADATPLGNNAFVCALFLSSISLLPVALLYIFSFVFEPAPLPRYSIYTALPRLALLGGVTIFVPKLGLRAVAALGLTSLMAWQLLWMFPLGARTGLYSAARIVAAVPEPPAIILAAVHPDSLYIHFPLRTNTDAIAPALFKFYLPPEYEVTPGASVASMAQTLNERLPPLTPELTTAEGSVAFAAFLRIFDHDPISAFEAHLQYHGLCFMRHHFYGYEGLTLYRVWRSEIPSSGRLDLSTPEVLQVVRDWELGQLDAITIARLERALHSRMDASPPAPIGAADYTALAFILASEDPDIGLLVADAGLVFYPLAGDLHLARWIFLLLQGRMDEAQLALKVARKHLHVAVSAALEPVLNAAEEYDFAAALKHFAIIQRMVGGIFDPIIAHALEHAAKTV